MQLVDTRIRKIFGTVLLVWSCTLTSREFDQVPGSNLEDFFTAAINFSPELRIAEENLNISSAQKRAANAQLLPQLSAGANVSENRQYQLNRFREFDGERYFISLSQTLFNWEQFAARKQARLVENQLEEEYYYALSSVLTEVADSYFNVLQSQNALSSLSSEIEALINQLNQIQSFYDLQLAQITDLYQGQASLAAAQAQRLQLEAELALNQESLRSISGLDVGPLFELNALIKIPDLEFDQDYYLEQAQNRNHQILAREFALRAADQGVSARRGASLPQISIIAQKQDSDVGFDNLQIAPTDTTYIGLNISIPIFSGGRNRAGIDEAISRRSIAEHELRLVQLQARESVRLAHLQVQTSSAQTEAAEVLVDSTALASQAMQEGFSLGTVTSVDVLNALRDQFQAERDLQEVRYNHIKYLLTLKREAGILTAEDISQISDWLVAPQAQ